MARTTDRMNKALVGGIIAVLVGGAGAWIYFSGSASAPSSRISANNATPSTSWQSATAMNGADVASAPQIATQSSPPSTALSPAAEYRSKAPEVLKAWITSRDHKALFDQYRPLAKTDGDTAYLLIDVIRACGKVTFEGKAAAETRLRMGPYSQDIQGLRKRVHDDMWSKCQGFDGFTAYDQEINDLRKSAEANGSKAIQASKLPRKDLTEQQIALAKQLIESRDPFVLEELAPMLSQNAAVRQALKVPEGGGNPDVLFWAWNLATCDFGAPCDELGLPWMCIESGACAAQSYQDAIQQVILTPRDFELAMRYRDRIVQILQKRDWGSLGL